MDTANHISDFQGIPREADVNSETGLAFAQRELGHDSAGRKRQHHGELVTTKRKKKRKVPETGFGSKAVGVSRPVPPQLASENTSRGNAKAAGRMDQRAESMLFHVHQPFPPEDSQIGNSSGMGSQPTTFLPGMDIQDYQHHFPPSPHEYIHASYQYITPVVPPPPQLQPYYSPHAVALPESPYHSNEDALRAIQNLHMAKVANGVKTLGEATTAAGILVTHEMSEAQPSPSGEIAGVVLSNQLPSNQLLERSGDVDPKTRSGHEVDVNEEHAYLLANKWLNANKLAELVKAQGLVYKKGKFSTIEEKQVKDAIENFRLKRQLAERDILDIIFAKGDKTRDNAFWIEITTAVPLRPIIAVYHHVRRTCHPLKQQGRWSPSEDSMLQLAVEDLGQHWEKVSERVGRMAADCRDRYRNHIVNREVRVTGHWTKNEEEELTRIVTDMTVKQGKDFDNDVFWGKVSELMGGRRGRQQCRIKWTDALSKTIKNDGQKPRWSQQDAYILVHKVDSLNVRDDTEIDWKTLSDDGWNLWSAHSLQRRWLTLKKSVKGYEHMAHEEIMDILRVKKSQLPPVSQKHVEGSLETPP